MRRPGLTTGQSIVEMALMLPILLLVIFGIIEFGWLIFAYSTISQAARNGAEVAAQLPPYQEWLDTRTMNNAQLTSRYGASYLSQYPYPGFRNDRCVDAVLTAVESDVTMFGETGDTDQMINFVTISYPNGSDSRNLNNRGPVQVEISYPVTGLTPLWSLLDMDDGITMRVTQRRSIESLGRDPTSPTNVACASDPKSYWEINSPPATP